MSPRAWTAAEVERLNKMLDEGLSASKIGRILDRSRNSVIGQVHRQRLRKRQPRVTYKAVQPKPRRLYMTPKRLAAVNVVASIPKPIPEPVDLPPDVWTPIPGTVPVSMADLDAGMCKWPIGEGRPFLFCGCEAMGGSSYCPSHDARSRGKGTAFERAAVKDAKAVARREQYMPEAA